MMCSKAFLVLVLFVLALVPSNVAESLAELYWKSKLGNITMPKVIKASLQEGSNDGIVKLNSNFQKQQVDDKKYYHINYVHENPIPQDGRVEFFTEEKLSMLGTKIKLHFNQIDDGSKFLPSHVTKSKAFASHNLEEILNLLSVNPKSVEAKFISKMLKECKEKGIKDEVRYCANSLKDMIDFITSRPHSKNSKLMVASTEEENETLMEYTIQKAQKLGNDDKHNIVCHRLNNPFVVFLCHNIKSTDIYRVSLVGANGKQMNAIAVCHKNTSEWYPGHISFQLLKLKPGTKPICHVLSGDAVVWIQNQFDDQ
ncbi:BURP domain-containing protein 5 [Bienertia sinuspersici]